MDKNAIKKYAVWARRELIERVSQRAMIYGITAKNVGDPDAESVNGHLLSQTEKRQRQALIHNIQEKGYEQVMEEVAYTWFNRFAALRFMEVNGYLPSHIRVFTNDEGKFKPQILAEAIHLELDGLDMEKVYELESANKSEELFKYLLIIQCNALNSILPRMFQKLDDYTVLLLPDYLLREGSVIEQMVTGIPEADWTDQVQIIGWLYQYYNTEPKDKVFADLKKNIKITRENIPAATQLFTPDWIVHYMVENSLGRLWLEGHPNDALKSEWKYYLDEAEQEAEVQVQLDTIRKEYAFLKPEEICAIDPCMGSGHILCVLFDTFVRIYEDYGFTAREAAVKIIENNLWGLDIDERAAQLSYFAVMMKARQYDRRFFSRGVQPHVYAFEDSNGITSAPLHDMGTDLTQEEYGKAVKQIMTLIEEFHDAKEYGSIINVSDADWDLLRRFAVPRWESEGGQISLNIHGEVETAPRLQALINLGQTLVQKYDVVVTNPPYMGSSGMGDKLSTFVKAQYPDTKSDMSTVCMERCLNMCNRRGLLAMINIPVWMFLTSYEKLRKNILNNNTYINMVHPGRGIFGSDFGTTSFVIAKKHISGYIASYRRLFQQQGEVESITIREQAFLSGKGCYFAQQDNFAKIPGAPVAYWVGRSFYDIYEGNKQFREIADIKSGVMSGDDGRFTRLWFEVPFSKFDNTCADVNESIQHKTKWFPVTRGGAYRKWYGNLEYVINLYNGGYEIEHENSKNHRLRDPRYYFLEGITWSMITAYKLSVRYVPTGILFGNGGPTCFFKDNPKFYLAVLNSKVAEYIISVVNPSLNTVISDIEGIPIVECDRESISRKADRCIALSKQDWDSFETSWDFETHPIVRWAQKLSASDEIREYLLKHDIVTSEKACPLDLCYTLWKCECDDRFNTLKREEVEINRAFIEAYGLQDEISPEVEDRDVTVRRAELKRDIKSLISYAVGCVMGRYSLNHAGLQFAGGDWADFVRCNTTDAIFIPDPDGIIPITDDEYFDDDIVAVFIKWMSTVFGEDHLEENLMFIASALGGKGSSRHVIREYFINDFFNDHCAMYSTTSSGKRPIYWMFDSGKKNGFKCLIYMHRYQPDTIARIRTDYVHEQQSRYRTAIADLEQRINGASTSERVKLTKQLTTLQAQAEEIRVYEEKIHHLADQMIRIDLDDGLKHNYAIFKDVLAKIK